MTSLFSMYASLSLPTLVFIEAFVRALPFLCQEHPLSPLSCFWLTSPPSLLSSSPGECPSYNRPITHTHTHTHTHITQTTPHTGAGTLHYTDHRHKGSHIHTHTCTFTHSTCRRLQTHTRTHHMDHSVCTPYMP